MEIHPKTGEIEVYTQKKIVEKVVNPADEISLEDARSLKPNARSANGSKFRSLLKTSAESPRKLRGRSSRKSSKEPSGM